MESMSGRPADSRGQSLNAWILGGALFIAASVFAAVVQPAAAIVEGAAIIGAGLFSASILIFAYGLRGAGSVTASQPVGTAALTVLAIWTLVASVVLGLHLLGRSNLELLATASYADLLVRFAAAIVAVIAIGRAGTVRAPWNWAPAWAMVTIASVWVLDRLVGLAGVDAASLAFVIGMLDGLVHIGAGIFLGALAIVLALTTKRHQTVSIPLDGS